MNSHLHGRPVEKVYRHDYKQAAPHKEHKRVAPNPVRFRVEVEAIVERTIRRYLMQIIELICIFMQQLGIEDGQQES